MEIIADSIEWLFSGFGRFLFWFVLLFAGGWWLRAKIIRINRQDPKSGI